MGKGLEPISMQMSGGHLLAAGFDGGNSIIFTEGENVIKSRLAENIYSVGCLQIKKDILLDVLFYLMNEATGTGTY